VRVAARPSDKGQSSCAVAWPAPRCYTPAGSLEDGRKDEDGSELSPEARAQRAAAPYISAVWRVVGGVLVGAGAGWFADAKLHSSPWGLIIGLFLGMGVGFYAMIQGLNSMNKR